jgi:hypothetical protein
VLWSASQYARGKQRIGILLRPGNLENRPGSALALLGRLLFLFGHIYPPFLNEMLVKRDDTCLFDITSLNQAIRHPGNELLINPVGNLATVRVRGIEVTIGISKALDGTVPSTMVSEKTVIAGFHVLGNPMLQLLNTGLMQYHPTLDRINFTDKKCACRRIIRIKHLVACCDISIRRDTKILATGSTELLMAMLKTAHARVTDIYVKF